MPLFPWKKSDDLVRSGGSGKPPTPPTTTTDGFDFSPDKGKRFFDRALTVHEATNFEYAMTLWLQGLRFDPASMSGLDGFFRSAGAYMNANPSVRSAPKDVAKEFGGRSDLDKYLLSLLEWSAHPTEAAFAVKAVERASSIGLHEASVWLGERALGAAMRDRKPKKEHFVALMNALAKAERFDLAVQAGQQAVNMDPADARLAADVKNMSAESTMRKGGFDETGKEGGFRANIRDAQKQKQLDEASRMVVTEDVLDRQVASARADHETAPMDKPLALRYVDLLTQRGTGDDLQTALIVLDDMHRKTQEFRFRERADAIRLRMMSARLRELKGAAEAPGAPESAKDTYRSAFREFAVARIKAMQLAVAAYPTDLIKKFELGKALFEVRKYEDAIPLFQDARADPKNRAEVLRFLGLSFQSMGGFNDEAIGTLKEAIGLHADPDDAQGMALRYALMEALFERARESRSPADADESYKIASAITIKQINYREVRARRDQIKAFLAELRSAGNSP